MLTAAGIFESRRDAELATEQLRAVGFDPGKIMLLTPGSSDAQLESVPTTEGEQPGMGKAIGAVAGGAVGLAAGATVAGFLLPGVGPIIAIGLGAAAFGAGGAVAGAATGGAIENMLTVGLPKDEIFLYEDALRKKRTVLIAVCEDETKIEQAREVMKNSGAQSIDLAREQWWTGLRSAEEAEYDVEGEDFKQKEEIYRRGFEAALEPELRGRPFDEVGDRVRARYPQICDEKSFRRGFERGQMYLLHLEDGQNGRTESAGAGPR
jgi:hypothetical protein